MCQKLYKIIVLTDFIRFWPFVDFLLVLNESDRSIYLVCVRYVWIGEFLHFGRLVG